MLPYVLLLIIPFIFSFVSLKRVGENGRIGVSIVIGRDEYTKNHNLSILLFFVLFFLLLALRHPTFGRDLVREYVDAFRAEGLKVGFYYSLIDWHHPDFTIDRIHPRRDDVDAEEKNRGRDMKNYAEYMRNQVTELLTNYGKIDILWFDFSYSGDDPNDLPWMKGKGKDDWEACRTFSGSWGYYRDESTWKTPKMLIDMLVNFLPIPKAGLYHILSNQLRLCCIR